MCLYIRILVNIFRSARASNTVHAALCPGFAKYVDFFTRYFGEFRVLRDFLVNRANFQTCPHKRRPQGKPITYSIRTENENGQTLYYTCTIRGFLSRGHRGLCKIVFHVRMTVFHATLMCTSEETFTLVSSNIDDFRSGESSIITDVYSTHAIIYERITVEIVQNNNNAHSRIIKLNIITE